VAKTKAVASASRIYLDSNIFIYHLERASHWHELACQVFVDADRGGARLITSDLAVAECLLQPHRSGNAVLIELYERFFDDDAALERVALDYDLLKEAALIGGLHGMKLLDSIHVASAIAAACEIFITNDSGIRGPAGLNIVQLSDL
jgi:predicted nucleic acid-binding protein